MIYVKTLAGRQALKERSESMPRKYHFPFLMCDGQRDSAEILAASSSHGFTSVDLYEMVQAGFIAPAPQQPMGTTTTSASVSSSAAAQLSGPDRATLFVEAEHLATSITAKLGLRGFRLNLAVEKASNLAELKVLLPQIQEAAGMVATKPLADLLKNAGV